MFCPVLFYLPKSFAQVADKFSSKQKIMLDTFQLSIPYEEQIMSLKNPLNKNLWIFLLFCTTSLFSFT